MKKTTDRRSGTWDGEGGFCHIGGHHNEAAAWWGRLKHLSLCRPGQVGVQGQHVDQPCSLLLFPFDLALCPFNALSKDKSMFDQ